MARAGRPRASSRAGRKRLTLIFFADCGGRARASTAPSPPFGGSRTRAGPKGRARNVGGNPTPAPAPDTASSERSLVPAIIAGSIAVVGLAAGIGFTVSANGKESDADAIRKATGPSGCAMPAAAPSCDRLRELESSEDRQSTLGAIGFVVGGVGAAAALGYLLWPADPPPTATSSHRRVKAIPALGPKSAALIVSTSF